MLIRIFHSFLNRNSNVTQGTKTMSWVIRLIYEKHLYLKSLNYVKSNAFMKTEIVFIYLAMKENLKLNRFYITPKSISMLNNFSAKI